MSETTDTVRTFDPVWEKEVYGQGNQLNHWPMDLVVSFVFRQCPRDRPRHGVRILEVGCGAGNNLWFAAREGFTVSGIDGSRSAIEYARKRFEKEGLKADLREGDFTKLPFEDNSFDLAIDRWALSCTGRTAAARAIAEVRRVLVPGGKFLFDSASDRHTSATHGKPGPDGLIVDITKGSLVGLGQMCFYGRSQIESAFSEGWAILSLEHFENRREVPFGGDIHAEWRTIVEKTVR